MLNGVKISLNLQVGRIKSCTKEGVYISLGFFDDILLPPEALQHPSKFDENDQVRFFPPSPTFCPPTCRRNTTFFYIGSTLGLYRAVLTKLSVFATQALDLVMVFSLGDLP